MIRGFFRLIGLLLLAGGFIFMVYVVATANLGFKLGWSLGRMVLVMLAGCVPFLSFWAEGKVSREAEAQLDRTDAAADT